ncbi:MAG: C40 family peptidase [Clostridia bacterium]|nr:C40 family peptidase [Clostridia bacterium]
MQKAALVFMLLLLTAWSTSCRGEIWQITLPGKIEAAGDTAFAGFHSDAWGKVSFSVPDASGETVDILSILQAEEVTFLGAAMHLQVTTENGKLTYLLWQVAQGETLGTVGRPSGHTGLCAGESLMDFSDLMAAWIGGAQNNGFLLSAVNAKKKQGAQVRCGVDVLVTVRVPDEIQLPYPFRRARIQESEILDSAFSMLEEENAFLQRYDDTAGALTEAVFPLGLPYYFGGRNEEKLMMRLQPTQESHYFRKNRQYLYGFDCAGFTKWAYRMQGKSEHPDLADLLRKNARNFVLPTDHTETWQCFLEPGDVISVDHGYDHSLMYIGTLRTLGFREDEVERAEEIMDLPLAIHCGTNPMYYARYSAWLLETGDRTTTPTDGGVTVSVIMPDRHTAPHVMDSPWGTEYGYYEVQGSPLLVFPLDDCTAFAWYSVRND